MPMSWIRPPVLHDGGHRHKKISWLEIFQDLLTTGIFAQLAIGFLKSAEPSAVAPFFASFMGIWATWLASATYTNRFTSDDLVHKIWSFVQLVILSGLVFVIATVFKADPIQFSLVLATLQFSVTAKYLVAWRLQKKSKPFARCWAVSSAISGTLWLASALLEAPWNYAVWILAILGILYAPFNASSRASVEEFPLDLSHLSDRFGIFTIILIGLTFISIISDLASGAPVVNLSDFVIVLMVLLAMCSIWWIRFGDAEKIKISRNAWSPIVWQYAHLPFHLGILLLTVGIRKLIVSDHASIVSGNERWIMSVSLMLVLISSTVMETNTDNLDAKFTSKSGSTFRVFSALILLLLAPAGYWMTGSVFASVLLLICVLQAAFSNSGMSKAIRHTQFSESVPVSQTYQERIAGTRGKRRRRDVGAAVRKGAPTDLRRDLYFFLMDGSWTKVFAVVAFFYLAGNTIFALIYMLEPGSIANARPGSLLDAFFFSVQTMGTIGYGVLNPQTLFGNWVVTAEAAVGMLGVALATGLMFAKASRPRPNFLFSQVMTVNNMNGKRTISFRVGNTRGNDIVDAKVSVNVVLEEVTAEGQHLRRMYPLTLIRDNSPLFALTWVVMHEINADSALNQFDWSEENLKLVSIIVTLMGHDGTYGQTCYARHIYYPDQILADHRFVDVISELPDGRLMIDYDKFHFVFSEQPAQS